MKKVWILIGALLAAFPAYAEEAAVVPETASETAAPLEADDNAPIEYIVENQNAEAHPDEDIPACDDARLISRLLANSRAYMALNPPSTVLEKRTQKIISRNMDKFAEISADNFKISEDFNVASKIVTVKINQGLEPNRMRLCKSTSEGVTSNVYFLVYDNYGRITVDVINFSPLADMGREFTFNYW